MSELMAEERAEVIRAIKEQRQGAGPGADVVRPIRTPLLLAADLL